MNKSISQGLQTAFLIHFAISLIFGLPLLIIPGRSLLLMDWWPIDPVISRLLGAALLAMALGDWLCYQATEWEVIEVLLQFHIVFTVLGAIGLLRHLLFVTTPAFAWVCLVILVIFAAVWIYFFLTDRPEAA